MKRKQKAKPRKSDAKVRPDPRAAGKYAIARDESGLTPKQRLDEAKAIAQEFVNRRESERWQTREQAVAAAQETAEMIQGDLYGTLPLAVAGKLAGAAQTAAEVRRIVRAEVDAIVRGWVKGGGVPKEAIKA